MASPGDEPGLEAQNERRRREIPKGFEGMFFE